MKIKLFDKVSFQLGAIGSSVYLMSAVCPCCGKPTMTCAVGVGGSVLVGGAFMIGRAAVSGVKGILDHTSKTGN